jgi:Zn-dependent M28 family amino/carboxypeptidase
MKLRSKLSLYLAIFTFSSLSVFAQATAPAATKQLSSTETELASKITIESIKDITAALSADDMQGRGTMQAGGDKAANYIADKFSKLGLKPLGDKGTYLQKIDFRETSFAPETSFKLGEESLKLGSEFSIAPFSAGDKSANGDLVFVGYAIEVDSLKIHQLGGMNIQGKIAVMLEGPPTWISKKDWEKAKASQLFVRNLFQNGAAGVIIIGHGREEQSPDMMIDYFSRRQVELADEGGSSFPIPLFTFVGSKAAEKLFTKSTVNLKDALAQAETKEFKAIKLNQAVKIKCKLSNAKGSSNNVAAFMEGSDPKLKEEAIVFSAHYDAYGIENGKIYHGAADNALGVAEMIAVAESFVKSGLKPKRSLIFLAVTAEEYGLYGSKYWAKNPTWKIKQVAANLNLDGIGTEVYGPVKTFVGFGAEHSTIGATLEDVSAAFGIKVIPDPMPDEKIFYRSDHYSFVEKGIPSLMLLGAPEGDPQAWIKRSKDWEKTDYHQPADIIQPNWAWEGAKTVADVMGIMGWRISESNAMPNWLSTSRFAKLERGNTKEIPEEK